MGAALHPRAELAPVYDHLADEYAALESRSLAGR